MTSTHERPRHQVNESPLEGPVNFSLVLGGPLYQFLLKSHLEGTGAELLIRRLLVITSFAWMPLLLLNLIDGWAGIVRPAFFFQDIEVHARFLIALPALIAAEVIVHLRLRPVIHRFIERRIIPPAEIPRFFQTIDSAIRLRNSIPAELALLLIVYTVGLWVWNSRIALAAPTWYALTGGNWRLTPAGFWYVFVSIPLFQFVLLRWYLRLFIWFRFLWQVSRLDLHLVPTHPDRAAGLGFLGKSSYSFSPILFAQGAILAGVIASRIISRGESLLTFKLQIGGFVAFFVAVILGPLLMFAPLLARVKRQGLADYGLLAQSYVDRFDQKWVRSPSCSEELLGSGDIQSLADLGNSYAMLREMRWIPFGVEDISRLAAATAVPLLPLLLTVFSPEELIMRVIKILF